MFQEDREDLEDQGGPVDHGKPGKHITVMMLCENFTSKPFKMFKNDLRTRSGNPEPSMSTNVYQNIDCKNSVTNMS